MDWVSFVLLLLTVKFTATESAESSNREAKKHMQPSKSVFINTWAVVVHGDKEMARRVAGEYGFINKGKVFKDVYQFVHHGVLRRRKRASFVKTMHLLKDTRVVWAQQQESKVRAKRSIYFNDAAWKDQWYLYRNEYKGHDMNVVPVWNRGITGKGVVISILDDGIEHSHPELKQNYDPKASYDYNNNDTNPEPRYNWRDDNRHGTRCAGVAAAVANNSVCIVGVAYEASIGGIRMLDGEITDLVEAESLSHARNYIDIYSSSWGPDDDGKTVEGPGSLTSTALKDGVTLGRNGKGSIVVWASGNGGRQHDNCNCDGYTNSMYTISVSAVSSTGTQPWYSESCASTLVSAYSSGNTRFNQKIVTADLRRGCTYDHTGTSVAPPLVAGLIALALQVSPELTWRDVQHILVHASSLNNLTAADSRTNGVGKSFSHHFGFGIVDAEKLVNLAEKWPPVAEQHSCFHSEINRQFPNNCFNSTHPLVLHFNMSMCSETSNVINYIEHVHVVTTFYHYRRGASEIKLVSPSGTVSWMLRERQLDVRGGEFKDWKFLSTHFWGENANGVWKVYFISKEMEGYGQGYLEDAKLVLYGTEQKPGKRTYPYVSSVKPTYNCNDQCEHGCHGSGNSNCNGCRGYFYNLTGKVHCVASCPVNMYTKSMDSLECLPCHSTCATCSQANKTNCLSCPSETVLYLGSCIEECPSFMFKEAYTYDTNKYVCRACSTSCQTCSSSQMKCLSCHSDSILVGEMCVPKCSNMEWLNGELCQGCHPTCKMCNGNDPKNCTMCPKKNLNDVEDRYLYKHRECLLSCPLRTYHAKTIMEECLDCPVHCLQCSNEGLKCDICDIKFYRIEAADGKCVKQCPPGYYTDVIRRICEHCGPHCDSCVPGNPNACTSCSHGYYLKDDQCVESSECQTRYYVNETTGHCDLCPGSCTFCASSTFCTACLLNYYLTAENRCVEDCPNGTFPLDRQTACVSCSPECAECDGSASHECTTCAQGKHLHFRRCVNHVPAGHYVDRFSNNIKRCHHTCAECTGPGSLECTSCKGSLVKQDTGCINTCPDQYLAHSECQNCHPTCSACFGPSSDTCLSCYGNFSLSTDTNTCHKVCHRKFYRAIGSFICQPCHQSCASCSGPSPQQCITCPDKLHFFNRSCVLQCPSGWYKTSGQVCARCSAQCKSCLYKQDLCTSCHENHVWNAFKCFRECGAGSFHDANNRCYPCHDSCQTCRGTSPKHCLTCGSGMTFYRNMCLRGCLPGFYNNTSGCQACPRDCLNCKPSSLLDVSARVVCIKCSNNTLLTPTGTCESVCPPSTVRLHTDNVCRKCPGTGCLACNTEKTCTTCLPLHELNNGRCNSLCAAGYFVDHSIGECSKCHPSCATCNVHSHCQTCNEDLLEVRNRFQHLSCVRECPSGYYKNSATSCKPCGASCFTCLSQLNCTSCHKNRILYNSSCHVSCYPGYAASSNVCVACAELFPSCSMCNETRCYSCHDGFSLQNEICVASSSCVAHCKDCNKTCAECVAGYTLLNNTCVKLCEPGYELVNDTCACVNCSLNATTTPTDVNSTKPTDHLMPSHKMLDTVDSRYTDTQSYANETATQINVQPALEPLRRSKRDVSVTTQTTEGGYASHSTKYVALIALLLVLLGTMAAFWRMRIAMRRKLFRLVIDQEVWIQREVGSI